MKILNIVLLISIFLSCNNENSKSLKNQNPQTNTSSSIEQENIWTKIDQKKAWFLKNTKTYKTLNFLPNDFNEFYTKFISDSIFQLEHIKFPLIGAIGECDTTIYLNESNWEFLREDFREDFNNSLYSNTISLNPTKILVINYRNEIGVIFQIGFEKFEDNWFLTLIMVNNC